MSGKNFLICLIGNSPAVVMEIIHWLYDEDKAWCKGENLSPIQEVWIIGTDGIQNPNPTQKQERKKLEEELKMLYSSIQEKQIVWHHFRIKDTGELNNQEQSHRIGEGILRLMLLCLEQTGPEDKIYLSLAGGRKSMASYGFLAQFLVPIEHTFHVVAKSDKNFAMEALKDWQAVRKDIYPVLLPGIYSWDSLFRKLFLGLGRELNSQNYPLQRCDGNGDGLGNKNAVHNYSFDEAFCLLDDFNRISKSIAPFVSLGNSISFNFFKHDMRSLYKKILSDNPEHQKRWHNILEEHLNALDCLGVSLEKMSQAGEKTSPILYKEADNSSIKKELWRIVADTMSLVSYKLVDIPEDKDVWETKLQYDREKNILFSVCIEKNLESLKIPHRRHLMPVLRNLIVNMKKYAFGDLQIKIEAKKNGLEILATNKFYPKDKDFLAKEENQLGLPHIVSPSSTDSDENKGLGLYSVKLVAMLFKNQEKIFSIQEDRFQVKLFLRTDLETQEPSVSSVDILQLDSYDRKLKIKPPIFTSQCVKYREQFFTRIGQAKYLCIHLSDILEEKDEALRLEIVQKIQESSSLQCFFYKNVKLESIEEIQQECLDLKLKREKYGMEHGWQVALLKDLQECIEDFHQNKIPRHSLKS